jgi:hypothetical protein
VFLEDIGGTWDGWLSDATRIREMKVCKTRRDVKL